MDSVKTKLSRALRVPPRTPGGGNAGVAADVGRSLKRAFTVVAEEIEAIQKRLDALENKDS